MNWPFRGSCGTLTRVWLWIMLRCTFKLNQMLCITASDISPVKKKEGEDGREVGWGGVGRQVEHKQNNNTAGGRYQVVQLRRYEKGEHVHTCTNTVSVSHTHMYPPHHVPYVVSQPVDDRVTAADKLQVFGLCWFLCNQENHKAGWHERHGNNDEDGNHHICALESRDTEDRRGEMRW